MHHSNTIHVYRDATCDQSTPSASTHYAHQGHSAPKKGIRHAKRKENGKWVVKFTLTVPQVTVIANGFQPRSHEECRRQGASCAGVRGVDWGGRGDASTGTQAPERFFSETQGLVSLLERNAPGVAQLGDVF